MAGRRQGPVQWDVYTNRYRITEAVIGKQQTGNVAINAYDREQYLADIALMREVGLDAYRFSLSWPRILPEGHRRGEPGRPRPLPPLRRRSPRQRHQAARHPLSLGFSVGAPREGRLAQPRRRSAGFANYAGIVFQALADRVDTFITFNEPFFDLFFMDARRRERPRKRANPAKASPATSTAARRRRCTTSISRAPLAIGDFRARGRKGMIGIALPLIADDPGRSGRARTTSPPPASPTP